ncbi:hypothetical protein N7462_007134 [Penicillium macrosclerotiorum]|uniref:uncharacterized protein n=1 Tax=Penicillium macrosclerotiorum TaxID=303699 RepID=UPI0025496D82|nr:uncharacterized protein N7462_007134 [Penicillium macrosclerotiorum]KAJ5678890.1 hypothetical protein N7462_007134 [Penicillium macrosclerotiorum]
MSTQSQTPLPEVGKLVSVVPVGLKEAALDSPTFRATTLHFCEQIEFIEKWLDGYARAAAKLTSEVTALESVVSGFLSYSTHPLVVSEAVVDHDYTLLAMRRCGEGSKDLWNGLVTATKKMESLIAEPIRVFIHEDLRHFKETRRALEHAQKQYDYLQSRYASQSKSKEASALREEAFQLHEARKAYLNASMDFSVQAPQIRNALDRLLVRVSFDQWREFRLFHNNNSSTFSKWTTEMDRIKGWVHEMEGSDRSAKRELYATRKQIEEAAELVARPPRELEDYSISTVPYLGSRPLSALNMGTDVRPEKQGWVNLRTLSGRPSRTVWVRRWAFLKHGIFGCLVQGARTGGVEESERIGVLLCSVRPAFQEERRFCFQVKTKSNNIILQAETQKELMEWIGAFEAAKQKALENPASTDLSISGKMTVQDPAFSISQPPAPEFTADPTDSLTPHPNDESAVERSSTLPVPDRDGLAFRNSTDFGGRRLTGGESEGSTRDHAREHTARIIQKLDLHRKSNNAAPSSPSIPGPAGGIASLISVSHNLLNYNGVNTTNAKDGDANRGRSSSSLEEQGANLAPATLANPPAPTSMSKAAVVVSNERGIGLGLVDSTGGMPSGMMANLWGSSNWGFINKLEREKPLQTNGNGEHEMVSEGRPESVMSDSGGITTKVESSSALSSRQPSGPRHRQTVSLDGDTSKIQRAALGITPTETEYPSIYPMQLRIQDAQFRLLFPDVKKEEALVLVFRATWSPNDQQEFPGRAYVTTRNVYFYSHHFGLVLTTSVSLESIKEVTAASGRDCDFLFLHTIPPLGSDTPGRITIKTFLEPLRLLERRLNFLIHSSITSETLTLEGIIKELIRMDNGSPIRSSSVDSWEDVSSGVADQTGDGRNHAAYGTAKDLRVPIYIDKDLDLDGKGGRGRDIPKFKLPTQPVEYVPQGDLKLVTEKVLDVSPKALFHILFGDKSAVWQLLLHERLARDIKQGPWASTEARHLRREFQYLIDTADIFGRTHENAIFDYQIIDVLNDHLCYVITDKRTPWHLPLRRSFRLVSKVVITFMAKSKCKLAIYTKVEWLRSPYGLRNIIDKRAYDDLEQDALDLVDLVSDQVRRLGAHSRTKKAITIFGHVGRQNNVSQFSGVGGNLKIEPRKRTQRTMPQLLLETFLSFMESTVSFLMMSSFGVVRWTVKTVSAYRILLVLLITSVLMNGFYSSRDTWDWWHERHASNFMARIGVQPNLVMSKAIYIRDIDEAVANSTLWPHNANSSTCFGAFHEHTTRYAELPLSLSTSGPRDAVAKSATKRFLQTRERLGVYRHNLLVALRVVNSIEKEVIQNEWERWLREELRRCRQVEILLGEGKADGEAQMAQAERIFAENADNVKEWYDRYCSSCQQEQEQVSKNGRDNLLG